MQMYVHTRDRFIEILRSLDADQANTVVPHCPEWTVAGVASHVCGLNADLASGMRTGLGAEDNTARQVADRCGSTVAEICDEWLGHEAGVLAAFSEIPVMGEALLADLVVHMHDAQHALGLEIDRGDDATKAAARRYLSVLQERAKELTGLDVTVVLTDSAAGPGDDPAGSSLSLRANSFDFLRSYTARRSRRQVEALAWTGDPTRLLDDAWSPYGDPPASDSHP